jgi:hypothetical protein
MRAKDVFMAKLMAVSTIQSTPNFPMTILPSESLLHNHCLVKLHVEPFVAPTIGNLQVHSL